MALMIYEHFYRFYIYEFVLVMVFVASYIL